MFHYGAAFIADLQTQARHRTVIVNSAPCVIFSFMAAQPNRDEPVTVRMNQTGAMLDRLLFKITLWR